MTVVKEKTGLDFDLSRTPKRPRPYGRSTGGHGEPSVGELFICVLTSLSEHAQQRLVYMYRGSVAPRKTQSDNPDMTERFELFICGMGVCKRLLRAQ